MGEDFTRSFSTCFAVLGLKLLFGNNQVTIGSVLLLGAISGAIASAWTGGGAAWVELNIGSVLNSTLVAMDNVGVVRKVLCATTSPWSNLVSVCLGNAEEAEQDQL